MEYETLDLELKNQFIGKNLIKYNTISSTQERSIFLLEKSPHRSNLNGTVIVSDIQTKGKGRLKRKWISSPGGLWFSIILQSPNIDVLDINLIYMISTLSVCETLNNFIDSKAVIKWPNDIMVNSKKISGILIDTSITEEKIDYLVIGIGINVNIDSNKIKQEIYKNNTSRKYFSNMDNDITSMNDELNGIQIDKLKILKIILEKIEKYFLTIEKPIKKENSFESHSFTNQNRLKIVERFRELCETIGKRICIYIDGKEEYDGLAKGLDEYGYLILERKGDNNNIVIEKLYYGDISIRQF
ncbi:MAG: biotin--[acetyl-CoA-carboxylase] ligase [Nitrososphaeraceae archaeon]|nr:biotin--[acetyl-CoA-carboxylase] ligase [Nitrososphaeraceae archaeon]